MSQGKTKLIGVLMVLLIFLVGCENPFQVKIINDIEKTEVPKPTNENAPKVNPPEVNPPKIYPPEVNSPGVNPPEVHPPEIHPPEVHPPGN